MAIPTIVKRCIVFPPSSQEIVIVGRSGWISLIRICSSSGIDVIQETSHPIPFIVHNSISVTDSVQRFSRTDSISIIYRIVVLVRPLKEVYSGSRRTCSVTVKSLVIAIYCISIVEISQSTTHIAAHVIIKRISECSVHKNPEISIVQGLGSAVYQLVVVEGHVIDLVICSKSKCLCTDFHSDRFTLGFGMDIPFVIHHPPHIEVSVKRNCSIGFTIFCAVNVVPGIVSFFPFVITVIIPVIERCQMIILSFTDISVSRPVLNEFRNLVIREIGRLETCTILLVLYSGIIPCIELSYQVFAGSKVIIVFQAFARINFGCSVG